MLNAQDIGTRLGAAAWVSKPVDEALLLNTIRQHVQITPGDPSECA
jgi:hypothetical protein